MAQTGVQLDPEKFTCSICLGLLEDPVTTACGHSYCMNCIKDHWNGEAQKGSYSCPQCRETFMQRPVLRKNTVLAELVEDLKKIGLQAAPADQCSAGPDDVACDVCTGRKMKAVKSCLVCLVSYCTNHLQPHYYVNQLKKHKLVEPSMKLQENICSRHDEVMKIFCRTDQRCICYLCIMDDHKGHETIPTAAERIKKQKDLEMSQLQTQLRIQDREKDVKLLQQEVEAINASAEKTVKEIEKIFTELTVLIQKRSVDLKEQIRSQQKTEVSRVKELQEKLEKEIAELKKKDAELKQIAKVEDHNQFLQSYISLSARNESTHPPSINVRPLNYFEDVTAAVLELRDKLQDILSDTWTNISLTLNEVDVLLSEPQPAPKTRADFLKYSKPVNFDLNTPNRYLFLSERNRKATLSTVKQFYLDHPERFTDRLQVLSRESLTGRCYWEVEWRGKRVDLAVAYKSISRAGNESDFRYNDKSWSLYCNTEGCLFWHNRCKTFVSSSVSSRVGVYLDHRAGILAFYSISSTMTLLYRVQTRFTQPLHAGVGFYEDGAVRLIVLK
ncbi:tripartite motif-containing protein 16-like isoform X2 [Cyprinodon tularosa]|uniref:tripartite motif-containing protein 16-like isoform X2 n=1 Tax=Cyprinodon tularosa TaxID=77115 RepID=UPI0018E24474|nr:tripartite motif-containing protein 16-like isoform X2 [Cyprinodon tularosa]